MLNYQITKDELEKLQGQLDELKLVKRPEVIERLKIARSYGDLSENSEYDSARDEQTFIELQISDIEEKIKYAEIIDTKNSGIDVIDIGKTVKIKELDTNNIISYQIVGMTNVDPFALKISKLSPIGKALSGHKIGDEVIVKTPYKEDRYSIKILSIKYS